MSLLLGKKKCEETRYDAEGNATVMKQSVSWICIVFAIISCISAISQIRGMIEQKTETWKIIAAVILHGGGGLIFLSHCTRCDSWPGFWKAVLAGILASSVGATLAVNSQPLQ